MNEKDKAAAASGLTTGVVKRSDIFGESSGGAGLDDAKVRPPWRTFSHVAQHLSCRRPMSWARAGP
jgi:hypothetical protein